jgi:hypothetical protein
VPLNARSARDVDSAGSPRGAQPWLQVHAGFLRAVLLIFAYCSVVISLISIIAFRGIVTISIVTGALFFIAVIAAFLLPRSRRVARSGPNR